MIAGSRAARQRLTVAEKGREFLSSMIRGIQDPSRVSEEERERRLEICSDCEEFANGWCQRCSCPVRFKSRLETWHCIDGKW